jgi:hypothetical protein
MAAVGMSQAVIDRVKKYMDALKEPRRIACI